MGLVFFEHGTEFLLSGLQMGLIYEVGWDTQSSIPNLSQGPEVFHFPNRPQYLSISNDSSGKVDFYFRVVNRFLISA